VEKSFVPRFVDRVPGSGVAEVGAGALVSSMVRVGQTTTAGTVTVASSLKLVMASSVM